MYNSSCGVIELETWVSRGSDVDKLKKQLDEERVKKIQVQYLVYTESFKTTERWTLGFLIYLDIQLLFSGSKQTSRDYESERILVKGWQEGEHGKEGQRTAQTAARTDAGENIRQFIAVCCLMNNKTHNLVRH